MRVVYTLYRLHSSTSRCSIASLWPVSVTAWTHINVIFCFYSYFFMGAETLPQVLVIITFTAVWIIPAYWRFYLVLRQLWPVKMKITTQVFIVVCSSLFWYISCNLIFTHLWCFYGIENDDSSMAEPYNQIDRATLSVAAPLSHLVAGVVNYRHSSHLSERLLLLFDFYYNYIFLNG